MQPTRRRIVYSMILFLGFGWMLISADKIRCIHLRDDCRARKKVFSSRISNCQLQQAKVSALRLRGTAVLVNLWATWCPPCRAEMPAIRKVYNEYKDQGFVVLVST